MEYEWGTECTSCTSIKDCREPDDILDILSEWPELSLKSWKLQRIMLVDVKLLVGRSLRKISLFTQCFMMKEYGVNVTFTSNRIVGTHCSEF